MDDSDRIFLEVYVGACTLAWMMNCLCHVLCYNITSKQRGLPTDGDSESVLQFDWPIPIHRVILTDRVHITPIGIHIIRVVRGRNSKISTILSSFRVRVQSTVVLGYGRYGTKYIEDKRSNSFNGPCSTQMAVLSNPVPAVAKTGIHSHVDDGTGGVEEVNK